MIFRKKDRKKDSEIPEAKDVINNEGNLLKYPKPKILLIDMPGECTTVLQKAGYNVETGTFGIPYPVEKSDDYHSVFNNSILPNYHEQEVVIFNIECPEATAQPPKEEPGRGVSRFLQTGEQGKIDPRPFNMNSVIRGFDRISKNGGIFIGFISKRYEVEYALGSQEYGGVHIERKFILNNWSCLEDLLSLQVFGDQGNEIIFEKKLGPFGELIRKGTEKAYFNCVVKPDYSQKKFWVPLAKNKYGNDVAGLLALKEPERYILLLPQMPCFHVILVELIEGWLTRFNPKLFPHHESLNWIHNEEYEIPRINELQRQIQEVKKDAETEVERLKGEIETIRSKNEDWYTLLSGTDDKLVGAVINALKTIGFQKVIDVDEEAKKNGEDLREDIQIQDQNPILIVDVKGIVGNPDDSESMQAEKHAYMRKQEFNGNVKAITIINHQRNLPPYERDQQAFRKEMIEHSHQTESGLMTTWDLFRLLRNKETLKWSDDVVKPIFYRIGRIDPIPGHYEELGEVVHVWKEKKQ